MEIFKKIKPLSVNEAWQGKRFKTPKYKFYEQKLLLTLPKKELPPKPYSIYFEFGLSSKLADYDNCVKVLQDVLCKKYDFDDRDIIEGRVKKILVAKGEEYIKVKIETFTA
jgi:Holliday junction resolvase RusA-like endonuclease